MKKIELLMPAGNIEKMEYAIAYGGDAVYIGIGEFSLRSMIKGEIINRDNLAEAVSTCHKMGSKVYLTVNIFARNSDIESLRETLEIIKKAGPDGVIFSDPGIFNLLKREMPDTPLHLSTQANTLNYESAKFWYNQGVKRIILARELSVKEIKEIKQAVPNMEIECFVHGAQCISYSGRCLLSDYMTYNERQANKGDCAQPCRWNYRLVEETRPDEYYPIEQDSHGAYILSAKDLILINSIPDFIEAGVNSLKVEGRTKSVYYVSMVAKAYRKRK